MKATKLIGFLLVTILTSMPAFSEPATPESVKHLLQKTGAGNMSVQMMQQMIPSLKKMIPNAPESFWSDVMSEVDASEIENMIIPIYQKYLSEEDVVAINSFYDSSAGKKLIRVQPVMMKESMAVGQKWGKNLVKKLLPNIKISLKKTVTNPSL